MEGEFDRWFAAINGSSRNARGLSFDVPWRRAARSTWAIRRSSK
jgi:hypothetical protein